MKKTIYTFIAFIAVILTITTACVQDEVDEFPESVSNGFSIDISFGNLSTRALTTEEGDYDGAFNENKINSLDIFFYQGTTLKWRVNGLTYKSEKRVYCTSCKCSNKKGNNSNNCHKTCSF